MKKGVLRSFTKFTGKHTQFTDLRPASLFKKRLWHRFFPVNLAKFLRTLFLHNTSGRWILSFLELRGAFRTLSNIWDEAFLRKLLTAFSRLLFLQKCSIVDPRLGSKYASRVVPLCSIGVIRILA